MSQKYKLQLCILNGIGELSLDMGLSEKEIDMILETISPYLSNRQPQTLQDACFDTFKLMATEFSDLVWLHLMSICPKQLQFETASAVFPSYQFQDKSEQMKEYQKNVHRLLDII
uniref:Telo2-interacting protein 1-like protein n=2 Tax=Triatoma infestans TaxID=30076 RepID=A0A170Y898_TRIIF